jgi:hypothetical protein
MTARVPALPHCLLDGLAYGVLGPHHLGDLAPTEDCVAVVACAQDDRARLVLAVVPASALSSAAV